MAEDHLRTVLDGISARIQAELESQFGALTDRHAQALEQVRRDASAEAEERYASRLDAAQTEWTARLQSEVQAARSELERTMAAEAMRARAEAEQAAAETS